jgi:hypothetical protein
VLRRLGASTIAVGLGSALLAQSSARHRTGVADGQVTINIEFAPPFAQVSAGTPVRIRCAMAGPSIGDTDSYVGSYGSHSRFQFVYVDARTGRAIAIFDGSGGPLGLLTPKDVSPDISAWTSARPAGAPDAHAVRFLPLEGRGAWEFQGEPVLFQHGDDFVYGLYDSWSRILKVERKAGAEWFRVDGEFGEKLVPLRERPPFGARRLWR